MTTFGSKPSLRVRKQAALRVIAGESSAMEEARKLGISDRSIRRSVEEERAKMEKAKPAPDAVSPTAEVPSGNAAVPGETPTPDTKTTYQAALEAAGVTEEKPATAADLEAARLAGSKEDQEFCLSTLSFAKAATVTGGAKLLGLDEDDPVVQEEKRLRSFTKVAIQENAGELAPELRKVMKNGIWAVVGCLAAEVVLSGLTIWGLAKKRGLVRKRVKPPPPPEEKPAPPPPPVPSTGTSSSGFKGVPGAPPPFPGAPEVAA